MGVIVQKYVQHQISRELKYFQTNFLYQKIENLLIINVQKQLDLSRQICLSSFAKRKGTQKYPIIEYVYLCKLYVTMHAYVRLTIQKCCAKVPYLSRKRQVFSIAKRLSTIEKCWCYINHPHTHHLWLPWKSFWICFR